MKILFLVSSMDGGGAERVAADLCNRWADQGHQVVLMPTFSGRGACAYALSPKLSLDFLADWVTRAGHGPAAQVERLWRLRDAMQHHAPDVVISFLPRVNVAALLANIGLGLSILVSERAYPPAQTLDPVTRILRWRLYPTAAAVVVQTRDAKRWVVRHCPGVRACVIPNAAPHQLVDVPPEIEPESVVQPQARVLLGVGRLTPDKGFDLLIRAFATLDTEANDWHLVMIGEGPERLNLEALVSESGLSGRVHLPGRAGNMSAWYARAALFALSSRTEGFPNALLEAMAAGVAPVSFDCMTGPGEIIHDGFDGRLVSVESGVPGFAATLGELIVDTAQRNRLGFQAKDVVQRFGSEKICRKWDALLAREAEKTDKKNVQCRGGT